MPKIKGLHCKVTVQVDPPECEMHEASFIVRDFVGNIDDEDLQDHVACRVEREYPKFTRVLFTGPIQVVKLD